MSLGGTMKHILSFIFFYGTISLAFELHPATSNTDSEIIDKDFVQIDITNTRSKNKSLVNWVYLNRPQEKEVESYNRIHHLVLVS